MNTRIARTYAGAALVVAVFGVWLALNLFGEPERTGVLAPFDLDDGQYAIVVSLGEDPLRRHTDAPLVRVIDDQALIAKFRNQIDVSSGLTDFLPGEGRPSDIYLFVYRNGEQVAGKEVTQANRVEIPDALLHVSRVVRLHSFTGFRDDYLSKRDQLQAQGALLVSQDDVAIADRQRYALSWVNPQDAVDVSAK